MTYTGLIDASFVKGSRVFTDRPTSIHHWQLRDLISPADNEEEFYCVHKEQVILFNSKTERSSVMMHLGFPANSMTCKHGYLAAGGIHSELEVQQLRTGHLIYKGSIGTTVNNALHVGKHTNGDTRLFVCSNDDSIKVYSLPAMQNICTIRCHVPINYASLSPDGRHLVCVGDCPPTLIYEARPTGYELVHNLTEASDVGMCCAWSHYGTLLAAAHQDGTAAVWEHRSGRLVAKYRCAGAARNVKFAVGPVDLLAISEHESVVHLLDARRWDAVERVQATPPRPPHMSPGEAYDISGIAFTPKGARLWVGLEDACMSFDMDTLKRRTFSSCGLV